MSDGRDGKWQRLRSKLAFRDCRVDTSRAESIHTSVYSRLWRDTLAALRLPIYHHQIIPRQVDSLQFTLRLCLANSYLFRSPCYRLTFATEYSANRIIVVSRMHLYRLLLSTPRVTYRFCARSCSTPSPSIRNHMPISESFYMFFPHRCGCRFIVANASLLSRQ